MSVTKNAGELTRKENVSNENNSEIARKRSSMSEKNGGYRNNRGSEKTGGYRDNRRYEKPPIRQTSGKNDIKNRNYDGPYHNKPVRRMNNSNNYDGPYHKKPVRIMTNSNNSHQSTKMRDNERPFLEWRHKRTNHT